MASSKMKRNRGQVAILGLMLGVVIIVLALAFAPGLRQFVTDARNTTSDTQVGLDCNNASISDFDKSTCTAVDFSLPFFIVGLIGIAVVYIGARIVFGGNA